MNLLDSIKQGWIAMLFIPVFFSCEQEKEPLQLEIENAVEARFREFQFPLKTIYIDSLRTDNEENIGIGNYEHPRWGSISAKAYNGFEYIFGDVVADTLQLDSLVLTLEIREKLLSEEEAQGQIFIYSLLEEIYSSVVYLADMEIPLEMNPVDTIDVSFLNTQDTVVSIRLDHLGEQIFDLIKDSTNLSGFSRQYAFVPSQDLNGFFTASTRSDTSGLRLYTSFADTSFYETFFTLDTEHFTSIQRDRTGSEIAGINDLDTLELDPQGSPVFPLFGLYPLADMRAFNSFLMDRENILFNKAEFNISTVPLSNFPVEGIRFFFYKENSGISGEGLLGVYDDWINTAILQNEAYFDSRPPSRPEISQREEGIYQSDVTIYAEINFDFFKNDGNFLNERVVFFPVAPLSGRSIQITDLPQFKIFFTDIKE